MPLLIHFGRRKRLGRRAVLTAWALRIYEDSLCGGCGQSSLLAYGPDGHDEYEAKTVVCHACAERQLADDQERDRQRGEKTYLRSRWDDPPEPEPERDPEPTE